LAPILDPIKGAIKIHGSSSLNTKSHPHKSTQHKTFSKTKNKMQQKFLLRSLVQLLFYTALVLAFASQMGIPLLANAG
jgi:hypothetical protein